jgi:hypothetical protein
MDSLQKATEIEQEQRGTGLSWRQVIAGIRTYAGMQPPSIAANLNEWADLLEGLHQLNEGKQG